jgi:hypothetical protein
LTIHAQQKPKIIRSHVFTLLLPAEFFKLSMLSKQWHKMMNPTTKPNA